MITVNYPYVGIDGCKGGWFCIQLSEGAECTFSIVQTEQISSIAESAQIVLIDIPIGLLDSVIKVRACDHEGRRLLGPGRGSSVFPAPARKTLSAHSFQHAVEINRQITGRGINRQSWAISPKIRSIDNLLLSHPGLRNILRECHPEICFWALNNGKPMLHNKKTLDGRNERMTILRRLYPPAETLYEKASAAYRRNLVGLDDIVDAMVAAITARAGAGNYRTLPIQTQRDHEGLSMEMVYCYPFSCP